MRRTVDGISGGMTGGGHSEARREERGLPANDRGTAGVLIAAGIALLILYASVLFLLAGSPAYMAQTRADLIPRLPLWTAAARLPVAWPMAQLALQAGVLLFCLLAMAAYISALVWVWKRRSDNRSVIIVVTFTLAFWGLSVFALPTWSSDIYAYVFQARGQALHNLNPYATPHSIVQAVLLRDPFIAYIADLEWAHPAPYGPAWVQIAASWQRLMPDDVVGNLLGFRTLFFVSNLFNLGLIWKILGRVNPGHRLTGIVFYGWSPVVTLFGQEHLDPVMALFALLGVYFTTQRRHWLSLLALTVSALVKFVTLPLVLAQLVSSWRHGSLRRAAAGAALVGIIGLLAFVPFWQGWDMVFILTRDPASASSASLLTTRRLLFAPGFVAAIVWAGWRGTRRTEDLLEGWAFILLWFALFLMPTFYVWYTITLIAVASLVASVRILAGTLAICFSALATNMLTEGTNLDPALRPGPEIFHLLWWTPTLIVAAWLVWSYRFPLSRGFLMARHEVTAWLRNSGSKPRRRYLPDDA